MNKSVRFSEKKTKFIQNWISISISRISIGGVENLFSFRHYLSEISKIYTLQKLTNLVFLFDKVKILTPSPSLLLKQTHLGFKTFEFLMIAWAYLIYLK